MKRFPDLPNKPLIEAIAEIKWGKESELDPGFQVIVGRLYERLQGDYPEIEDLPTAQVPPAMTIHMARHRFRRKKDGWPLVQIGPGILTVNETETYRWDDFSSRVKVALAKLYDVQPFREGININQLLLRYINAIEFDYLSQDLTALLSKKMRAHISIPRELFQQTPVRERLQGLNLQLTFPAESPRGVFHVAFGTGRKEDKRALIWELQMRSAGPDVPDMPLAFDTWLASAHELAEQWFFEIIKGELLESFLTK
ncbi:MAG: hypothetical protein C3F08_02915 [Candidatus Methylomirabilota bacterium]|nr:MAG: hypothetical protein C3F08_02915 [candidate division NC10 bacterium]